VFFALINVGEIGATAELCGYGLRGVVEVRGRRSIAVAGPVESGTKGFWPAKSQMAERSVGQLGGERSLVSNKEFQSIAYGYPQRTAKNLLNSSNKNLNKTAHRSGAC